MILIRTINKLNIKKTCKFTVAFVLCANLLFIGLFTTHKINAARFPENFYTQQKAKYMNDNNMVRLVDFMQLFQVSVTRDNSFATTMEKAFQELKCTHELKKYKIIKPIVEKYIQLLSLTLTNYKCTVKDTICANRILNSLSSSSSLLHDVVYYYIQKTMRKQKLSLTNKFSVIQFFAKYPQTTDYFKV